MTKPLDQFWVLTDERGGARVAYIASAYSRSHTQSDGSVLTAISPTFKTADETKAHIKMLIADLDNALASVDAAFAPD